MTPDIYNVWLISTFAINYSDRWYLPGLTVSICSFIWRHVHNTFGTPEFLHMQIVNHCESLVNPTIVTILRFICIKTEPDYIGRRRTTPLHENDTWVNNNCKHNASNVRGNTDTSRLSLFGPPCSVVVRSSLETVRLDERYTTADRVSLTDLLTSQQQQHQQERLSCHTRTFTALKLHFMSCKTTCSELMTSRSERKDKAQIGLFSICKIKFNIYEHKIRNYTNPKL